MGKELKYDSLDYYKVLGVSPETPEEELRQKYRMLTRKEALYFIHHPSSKETIRQSLRYLKYEEFLRFQLVMRACKAKDKKTIQ